MSLTLSCFSFIGKFKQFVTIHSKLLLLALLALACLILSTQYFSSWHKGSWFINFQKDSEALVIGKIIHDTYDRTEKITGNLYSVDFENTSIHSNAEIHIKEVYNYLKNSSETKISSFNTYSSQFGLQGIFYSLLWNKLGLSLNILHLLTAFLTAFVLTIISYQFSRIISASFGICFFVVCLLSPWLTSFARNLYWVPFTWFLPAIISNLFLLIKESQKNKLIVYSCFTVAIIVKSLCGYEYLSTVILFAVGPFVFLFITTNNKNKLDYFKTAFIICLLSLLGFVIAVLIHTVQRSDNLVEGLIYLVKNDIERRCYGSSDQFDHPILKKSLDASVLDVLKIYILNWYSKVLYVVSIVETKFWKLCLISVTLIIAEYVFFSKKKSIVYFALSLSFLLPPLSWYVLAKSHSFIHVHMNYVLWYFGFVQVLYFILIAFVEARIFEIVGKFKIHLLIFRSR